MQYRVDGRRVRESLKTDNRKVAEELRLRREFELMQQRLGVVAPSVAEAAAVAPAPPAEPAATLAEVRAEYEQWSKAHKRDHTIACDRGRLDAFFATVPGKALAEIRTADAERLLTQEATKGRRPATLLRHREILHAFWRWAVRQGHVERNIVSDIPRPRLPEHDPTFLGLDQVEELLKGVEPLRIGALVATAVLTGLRREELCWLCWDDLDLDAPTPMLRVRAKTIAGESWQTKTKRDRKVPVSKRLAKVLLAYRDAMPKRRGLWLFASPDGCRWDRDNLSREFRAVMKRLKLAWTFLDLRHTFGSHLARNGVSLLKIAKLMGNSPAIASKHYINLVPEEMASDVEFTPAGKSDGPEGAEDRRASSAAAVGASPQ
jgi:integrase